MIIVDNVVDLQVEDIITMMIIVDSVVDLQEGDIITIVVELVIPTRITIVGIITVVERVMDGVDHLVGDREKDLGLLAGMGEETRIEARIVEIIIVEARIITIEDQ